MIGGIGVNCNDEIIGGRPDALAQELAKARDAGFDGYEFYVPTANTIQAGRVVQRRLDEMKEVMRGFPLRYTVHSPCELRLTERTGKGREVFLACLEVSRQIGAKVMVYHSAQIALRSADQDTGDLPDAAGLREMLRHETAALKEMGARAADMGIIIGLENRDPHLWEVAALARHGKSAGDLLTYHAGMRLDLLAQQLEQVALANVGMCLDVGHAFLAAPYWQNTDYLSAIRQAAPWIKHVHFHDNFGRLDDVAGSIAERLVFGEADTHAPPGWGRIPLADVLAILIQANYGGWLVLEIRPRYEAWMAEAGATVRAMLAALPSP
jgi:sugar phosphate isomerase/epimerase